MKKNIIRFSCFGLMLYAASAMSAPLELVTLQYPPYQYEENGQTKGFVVEIVKEVFRRMQQPVNITLMPWTRSIKMIEDGTADAIFTAYKTAEREVFADYSKEVLMPQAVSLFVLKESNIKFDGDLLKLANYSFGAVNKVSYGDVFDNAVKNKLIKAPDVTYTGEQNVEKLLAKRFDIMVSNKYGALDILRHKGVEHKVKELAPEVQAIPSYMAFSKKRNLRAIRDKFDEILSAMKKDGSYQKIVASQSPVELKIK
ncbi:substrate-binding periplasmic protein [Iodobacter fluviatilis]|uniref:Amino acid ABC transporter substrate-binding protein (PAAT family) n=1 Tax=Iodobacter fluviatilis TaxID=537 RepID=A0A377STV1_9NEIS|nr:transporter substrate-binding domain-containing protein [Iodobacter fluviatilis]TCU87950.1 amino acid ABC transporter substrate-binding protein (PAAT family) [Iodobacter fluviatilis]STR45451.1 lysine-arginine-ornithine-binding periplasmic protein [Iodobacter fluviatilis]